MANTVTKTNTGFGQPFMSALLLIMAAALAVPGCGPGKKTGKNNTSAINPEVQVRAALGQFNEICSDDGVIYNIYNDEFLTVLGETLPLTVYEKTFREEDCPYLKNQEYKIEEIVDARKSEKRRNHVDGYGDTCEMIIPKGEAAGVLAGMPASSGKAKEYVRIGFHFKKKGLHYKIYRELRTCRLH
jgi:hypothetical protein